MWIDAYSKAVVLEPVNTMVRIVVENGFSAESVRLCAEALGVRGLLCAGAVCAEPCKRTLLGVAHRV